MTTTPILLTGGTGTLGRLLLPLLRGAGCDLRVLTRNAGAAPVADGVEYVVGDLATGAGVAEAVAGAATIVHCAGSAKGDDVKARNLVREATRAGAKHLVYISVVGADRVPVRSAADRAMFGYFAAKRAAEVLVAESGIPWTTLRASQFHELTLTTIRQMARMPVVPVPAGVRFQPVDGAEVARRLAELAAGEPAGLVPDLAGPKIYGMDELVRSYLAAAGKRRPVVRLRMGGGAYRAIRGGANLAPERAVGRRTWEEFLAENV
ncbi:SDR family oxidoreductase [Dactylosporangium sp. CA-139066]|uniref:SDR family oxidoreductase n=1 Tax=Dactylosporangium sp. CA-139066 TaxID=3239930 RepID=UPI003D8E5C1F